MTVVPLTSPSRSADPASWMTIDLRAVADNFALLKEKVGLSCEVSAVVKADSYGLGMDQIVATLENHGCKAYVTALPDEALALRQLTHGTIMCLSGVALPGAATLFAEQGIVPAINSFDDLEAWRTEALRRRVKLPAVLHFDTGMNRLGFADDDARRLLGDLSILDSIHVKTVMSHFACADEDHPLNARQFDAFMSIAAYFPKAKKSICNSSAVFRNNQWHLNIVRPGQALYGLNPVPGTPNPMKPAVTLEAKLLQVKKVPAGQGVGYGAAYMTATDITVGTVAAGYADGLFRSLGNKGMVYFKGRPCPVIGRVSMDLITVQIDTALQPRAGEAVEILGLHHSAEDLAAEAGTINYEILTALGRRYRRFYRF